MHDLIDEPRLLRLLRADVLPGEDHVERGLHPDAPRQALRATGAGDQPELDLGKGEDRLRRVRREAIRGGERELEPTAETGALDRDDERDTSRLDPPHHRVPEGARLRGIVGAPKGEELIDVGAGDEGPRLPADEHRRADRLVLLEQREISGELLDHRRGELVDRFPREVEGEDGDPVLHTERERRRLGHARSTTIAKPSPPAAQTVIRPNWPSRRASSFTSVVVTRAPVAPKG